MIGDVRRNCAGHRKKGKEYEKNSGNYCVVDPSCFGGMFAQL